MSTGGLVPRRPARLARTKEVGKFLLLVLPIPAGGAVVLLSFIAGHRSHWFWYLAGAVLCQIVVLALAAIDRILEKWKTDDAVEGSTSALTESRVELNGALEPVARGLGDIAGILRIGGDPSEAVHQTAGGIVAAASQLTGPPRGVRASYFRLSQDGDVQVLTPTNWSTGRAHKPRTVFRSDNRAHEAAFRMFDSAQPVVCTNIATDAPEGFGKRADRDYESFVSVPVMANSIRFGMLSVDAQQLDGFSKEDVLFIEVLAELLGATMAMSPEGEEGAT